VGWAVRTDQKDTSFLKKKEKEKERHQLDFGPEETFQENGVCGVLKDEKIAGWRWR
jgi:hypothetical protein